MLFNVKSLSRTTKPLGPNVPQDTIFGWNHMIDSWMYYSNNKLYSRPYQPRTPPVRLSLPSSLPPAPSYPPPGEGGRKLKKTRTLKNLRRK